MTTCDSADLVPPIDPDNVSNNDRILCSIEFLSRFLMPLQIADCAVELELDSELITWNTDRYDDFVLYACIFRWMKTT